MMQFVPSYNCINRKSIYIKDFLNNNQWEIMSKYSYLVQLIATIICYHVFNVSSNDIKIFDTLFCILRFKDNNLKIIVIANTKEKVLRSSYKSMQS